jgi:hypothetical protein
MSVLLLGVSAIASTSRASLAQSTTPSPSVLGCFAVVVSRWEPPMSRAGDSVFVETPTRIRLLPDIGVDGLERNGFLVRNVGGGQVTKYRYSYFRAIQGDSIELVWSTGFYGITMRVATGGRDTLTGLAHTFSDFDGQPQQAPVKLLRQRC